MDGRRHGHRARGDARPVGARVRRDARRPAAHACRRHPLPSRPHGERGLAHRALAGRALVHAGRVALRAVGVAFPRRGDPGATARALSAPRLRGGGARAARGRLNPYPKLVPTLAHEFHGIRDGDTLVVGGRRWEVVTAYGHAPEHAVLYCPTAGVLISGDQVLPKITTNVSVWPEQPMANPLRLYLDSLDRFQPLPATTLVLPSHGLPFRGLHARLDQLRDHHAARLGEAVDALVEPRSAAELVPVLFRRELDPHQLAFALGGALAHLRFLEEDGRVVRQVGADGVHRFLKA